MSRPSRLSHSLLALCLTFGAMAFPRSATAVDPGREGSSVLIRMTFVEPRSPVRGPAAIEIDHDGAVRISPDGRQSHATSGLSSQEMEQLSRDLFQLHRLTQITTEVVMQQIDSASRSSGLGADVPGASATVFEIRGQGQVHVIQCPAVSLLARRFPQVDDLQHLAAAQARLQNLMSIQQVGGTAAAEALAREGSEQLRRDDPRATGLTSRDLAMVRTLSDGSQFVQFYRDSQPRPVIVTLTRFPETGPRVSVFNGAAELR